MQCGRVGSRPLSTTEGSQGHALREPSLHLEAHPQRTTQETHPPAPPSEGRGVECQGRRQARRPRACTFSWSCTLPTNVGSSFASDSGDRAWCPIAGAVPASDCRGCALCRLPKAMSGRFPITRNHQHAFGSLQLWFASLGIRVEWEFRYVFSYV